MRIMSNNNKVLTGVSFLGSILMIGSGVFFPTNTVYAESSVSREEAEYSAPVGVPENFNMVWHDEFNGDKLDETKWAYAYSSFDTAARTQMHNTDKLENVSVSDGILHLTALYSPTREKWNPETKKMETVPRTNTRKDKNGKTEVYPAPFTSGAINTFDDKKNIKASFKGDFYTEARIKLPVSESSWSSFWLTGTNGQEWPGNGEIDVFESKGYDPSFLQANTHTPKSEGAKTSKQTQRRIDNNGDTQSDFHTYGVLKNGDKITFYYDGKPVKETVSGIKDPNPLIDPENGMTLRLSHMVGGSFLKDGTPGGRDYSDATKYIDSYRDGSRSDMLVDYVRVWQPGPTTEATTTTEAPTTAAPVTEAPTTTAPVTEAPTTAAPVTEAPTTAAPVTEAPTTAAPVTEAPTTAAPVTEAPTTAAPVTEAPTTTAGQELPNTGTTKSVSMIVGTILVICGGAILFIRKKA